MIPRRFVILDRDGTLIVHHHYLSDPEKVELLPGVAEGLRLLRSCGLGLIVVTNQSSVGRGYLSHERLAAIHARLEALLFEQGIRLEGIFYCPHTPDDNCNCRKPRTGLVMQAAQQFGFVPQACAVIGDNLCDIELGQALEATTFLVKTGYGMALAAENKLSPAVHIVDDVLSAAHALDHILAHKQTKE